ncbi:vomeronasal type-2 receptor 1-like [Lissotriton helveticus]
MSFVPTYKTNSLETEVALYKFMRKLRLRWFFHNLPQLPEKETSTKVFKPKSTFIPPTSHKTLDLFELLVKKDLVDIHKKESVSTNLTRKEWTTLKTLRENQDLTFQAADKGGALVVMDTTYYNQKVTAHVEDADTYIALDTDPTGLFQTVLEDILKKAKSLGWINEKTYRYLTTEYPNRPHIYMLPKLHKDANDPPFRPIVAGCGSIHEPIGKFLDYYLQPLVQQWVSYIQDTTDCLNKLATLQMSGESEVWLATIDVTALYTSIPHEKGIEAVEWMLLRSEYEESLNIFLLEILQFCLYHGYFSWQSRFYLQKTGTSMGFTGAPTYANIFMAKFEQAHILENSEWTTHLKMYSRYIDDILIVWQGPKTQLEKSIENLNACHSRIKFTHTIDQNTINFLDITISKQDDRLNTKVFKKPTDRNNALHYSSFHSQSLKNHLPFSQFIRIKRISSDDVQAKTDIEDVAQQYSCRGYPEQVLTEAKRKVSLKTRETLLQKAEKSTSKREVCVLKHSTITSKIKKCILKRWELIEQEEDFKTVFIETPIFALSRSKNLKELLKSKQLKPVVVTAKGMQKCYNCGHCGNTGQLELETICCVERNVISNCAPIALPVVRGHTKHEPRDMVKENLVAQRPETRCQLQRDGASGFSQDGTVLIGGIFPVHDARVYQSITFTSKPAPITCQTFVFDNYQWLQAMVFAIEEVNRNPNLLPNVTLGFQIYDSCRMLQRALEGMLWILSGQQRPLLNYECWGNHSPAAIIGDSTSTRSILLARILGLYRFPQISYSASSSLLSDRNQFPSFFRTIPSDDFQSRGLAELVSHFGWTWVGLVATDDDYGQQGLHILQEEFSKHAGCVAFSENIVTSQADKNAFHIVQRIKNSTAKAIVFFATDYDMIPILDELMRQNVTEKIWIASEGWSTSALFSTEKFSKLLAGTIGFENHNGEMMGFQNYLRSLNPIVTPGYMFIREFWAEAFGCKWIDLNSSLTLQDSKKQLCTGTENLEDLYKNSKYVTSFRFTYNIYTAVYAIALALQDLMSCIPGKGPFHHGSCATIIDFQPWQLLHSAKNVHMPASFGSGKFFDGNGNPPAWYDIVNWQQSLEGALMHVKVGKYDSGAPPGKILMINASDIQWTAGYTQVPASVCSASCPSGFRKVAREGKPICCFQCVQCPQGEISHQTDSIECFTCPWDKWPNEKQEKCIPKIMEFLSYDDVLGATLGATSIFSSAIPIAILGLFISYRNTPIVRANNRSISYLLLLSLTLCFLSSLAFIGHPTHGSCLFRQSSFGITFSLCVSCILAKTIMVVIAFNATKPSSNLRSWVGPHVSYMIISVSTILQILLCVSWLILSHPFSEYNIHIHPGKIIVECNEGSTVAFWCMLGYLGFLASISFIVAFLARKLPDSFNETKLITFSMLAFLSVWVLFVPAYLSTKGKYMVAMEVFAIVSSSSALVSCLFFPKCYIILMRPEINSKEHLLARLQATRKKRTYLP